MNIPQELMPYLKPDDLKYYQPDDVVHRCESRQFLARIDELDRQIGAETTNKSDRRKLFQARSRIAQHFAKHLDADRVSSLKVFHADDDRSVWVVLNITGTPSREGRQKAVEWMASRGRAWNGDVSSLRATMRRTLCGGNDLPDGQFGLRVERTIKIGVWSFEETVDSYNEGRVTALPPGPDDIVF